MDQIKHAPISESASYIFLLRTWREGEWRGRLQDLRTGEVYDFDGWTELIAALIGALPVDIRPPPEGDPVNGCVAGRQPLNLTRKSPEV